MTPFYQAKGLSLRELAVHQIGSKISLYKSTMFGNGGRGSVTRSSGGGGSVCQRDEQLPDLVPCTSRSHLK